MRLRDACTIPTHAHFTKPIGWIRNVGFALIFGFLLSSVVEAGDWTTREWAEVDRDLIDSCFTQTAVSAEDGDCVGQAAELCEYTPPRHGTTLDIMQCRMAEAVVWNEIVGHQFAEQRKALEIIDKTSASDGRISEADALTVAHEAWADFREAQCHLVYAVNQGGSIKNVRAPICILSMTAGRAFEMHELFREPQ